MTAKLSAASFGIFPAMSSLAALTEFASGRGLDVSRDAEVRPLTPALTVAPGGGFPARAAGELAPGLTGELLLVDSGRTGQSDVTAVLTSAQGSAAFLPALSCRERRSGKGDTRPAELPAESWREVELESVGFNRRYSLLTLAGQDPGFVLELFTPSLIVWLENEPPAGFSFELNEGHLVVVAAGLPGDAADLARLCALAGELVTRIGAEVDEEGGLDSSVFDEADEMRDIERGLSDVDWDEPPAGVQAAIARYRGRAARKLAVLAAAFMWGTIVAGLGVAIGLLISGPLVGLAIGALLAPVGFLIGGLVALSRFRWGTASVQRVGLEAFVREYARSRGLRLENRWSFHAAHRGLPVPGFADHVLAGELPGTGGLVGRFLMLGDAAELRTLGQEVAITSARPLASSALLVEAAHDLPLDAGRGVDVPEEYTLSVRDREILVWRPVQGNLIRTAEGSDRFCEVAGKVVRAVLAR